MTRMHAQFPVPSREAVNENTPAAGADLARDLVPIVIDAASARAAAAAVQLNPLEIARSPDASVQRLFDAIGAHATDELSLAVLYGLLPRLKTR